MVAAPYKRQRIAIKTAVSTAKKEAVSNMIVFSFLTNPK